MPDPLQVAWVVCELATQAVEKAAEADPRHLERAMSNWFPDADYLEQRRLGDALRRGLLTVAQLMENRTNRLVGEGKMIKVGKE